MLAVKIILLISIILQIASAILALRLIKTTGYIWGWLALAIAISLMAIRRMVSFQDLISGADPTSVNLYAEIVALAISILMLYGIVNIRPILRTLYAARNNLEIINQKLRDEVVKRKQAQEEAMINEEKFKKLAENSPSLIWLSDESAWCTYFNQKWLEFRGRTLEEEQGMGWTEGLHPDDKEKTINKYLDAFQKRNDFELEYRLLNGNNEYRWIYDIGNPLYDAKGNFTGYIGSCIDLTERRKMEKALEESEEKYRTIFNNAPLGIFRSTPEGKFLEVNPALAEMLGYDSPREVIDSISDIAKDIYANPKGRYEILDQLKNSRGIHKFINVYKRKDGSQFIANLLVKYTKDYKGKLKYLEGIVEDITKQKQDEEKLRQSEAQKSLILGTMRESLVYLDTDLKVKWLNNTAKEALPGDKRDFENEYCYKLWYNLETPCPECPAKRSLKSGNTEESEIRKNGRVYSVRAYPVKEYEKIKGLIELSQDITERKKAEDALKESEQKFRKIVNSLPQFVSYTDKNLTYRFVNQTYLERFEVSEDDIIGKKLSEIIGKESYKKAKPYLDKVFKGEKVQYREHFHYKNGMDLHMEGLLIPTFDDENQVTGYYAILTDITHLVKAQEELERSHKRIKKLSEYQQALIEKERNYIAREIHDDLGQYLTAIHMGLDWIKKQVGTENMKVRAKTIETIQLTNTVIQKVKKLSTELHPRIIDDMGLQAAIEWYVSEFNKNSNIECKLNMPEEDIELDSKTSINIFRIVQETLTNVYRHAKANQVTIKLEPGNDILQLTIEDDGMGIKEEDKNEPGKMGIIGMEERAHIINGIFNIEKVPGNGTQVTIKIPINRKQHYD